MRNLFAATTALALVLATPGVTQTMESFVHNPTGDEVRASGFIGARVYTAETDVQAEESWMNWDGDTTEWNDIGEINDVLMTKDGQIEAILVDVGGFLGIGEKQVAVDMDKLKLVSDGDDRDDYFVVFTSSRDALDAAPAFQDDEHAGLGATIGDVTFTQNDSGSEMTDDTTPVMPGVVAGAGAELDTAADTGTGAMSGGMYGDPAPKDGLTFETVQAQDIGSDKLSGARVYDAEDKWIGEVDELTLAANGTAEKAILDVGGFLGLGEKQVAVDIDKLNIQRVQGSEELRVYVDATKDSLMEMTPYDG